MVISSVFRAKLKRVSVMSRVKCLAILCLSSTAPIARPISALPRSGWRLRATAAAMRGGDAGEVALGGGEQILALAGALVGLQPTGLTRGGERAGAAGDEAVGLAPGGGGF